MTEDGSVPFWWIKSQIQREINATMVPLIREFAQSRDLRDRKDLKELQRGQHDLTERVKQLHQELKEARAEARTNAEQTTYRYERDRLEAEMRERFKQRNTTRKFALGLVDKFAAVAIHHEVIDERTLRTYTGERMIENMDYWLACALTAVAAVHQGDDRLRDHALSFAHKRNPAKTDLFMALVYPQLGRSRSASDAGATRMKLYLRRSDPRKLGREFLSVLDALAQGELGDRARQGAREVLARWVSADRLSAGDYQEQLAACRQYLLSHHDPFPSADYETLPALSGEGWETVRDSWRYAAACKGSAAYLGSRLSERPAERDDDDPPPGIMYTREALHTLIQTLEPDELAYQQPIDALTRALNPGVELVPVAEEPVDFVTLVTLAAFDPDKLELSPQAQRFLLASAGDWLVAAGRQVTEKAAEVSPRCHWLRNPAWGSAVEVEVARPAQVERATDLVCGRIDDFTARPAARPALMVAIGVLAVAGIGLLVRDWRVVAALAGVLIVAFAVYATRASVARQHRQEEVTAKQEAARKQIGRFAEEGRALLDFWTSTSNDGFRALEELVTRTRERG